MAALRTPTADDPQVVALARDLLAARKGADRAKLRRTRRHAEGARVAAFAAEQRAKANPSFENVTNAFARQLIVAALNLVDNPEWIAKVAS